MIAVDLHVHTCYSFDANTTPDEMVLACSRASIDCVAITDHGTMKGAFRMRDDARLRIIMGQEIRTAHGELIGLFLEEEVPNWLSPMDTIERIKSQGGLVMIPHPLLRAPFPRKASVGEGSGMDFSPSAEVLKRNSLLTHEVVAAADIIETVNSRSPFKSTWEGVARFADARGLPRAAGSDAHTPGEVGAAFVEMEDFTNAESFLCSLADGRTFGKRTSPWLHVVSTIEKLRENKC